jgi:hypothetical protein
MMTLLRRYLWLLYAGVVGGFLTYYMWSPEHKFHKLGGHLFECFSWSAVVAILVGVWLWKPRRKLPWYLLAVSHVSYSMALTSQIFVVRGADHPDIADAFYLLVHPYLLAALILFVYQRDKERNKLAVIDATLVGIGVACLALYVSVDSLVAANIPLSTRLTEATYLVLAALDVIAAFRLVFSTSLRHFSYWLLILSTFIFVWTNVSLSWYAKAKGGVEHVDFAGHTIMFITDLPTIIWFVISGVIALHPSMDAISRPPVESRNVLYTLPWRRIVIMIGALLPIGVTVLAEAKVVNVLSAVSVLLLGWHAQIIVAGMRRTETIVKETSGTDL